MNQWKITWMLSLSYSAWRSKSTLIIAPTAADALVIFNTNLDSEDLKRTNVKIGFHDIVKHWDDSTAIIHNDEK